MLDRTEAENETILEEQIGAQKPPDLLEEAAKFNADSNELEELDPPIKPPKKEGDLAGIVTFQCIMIVIIAIICVSINIFSPPTLEALKADYRAKITDDSEIMEKVIAIKDIIIDYIGEIKPLQGETQSQPQNEPDVANDASTNSEPNNRTSDAPNETSTPESESAEPESENTSAEASPTSAQTNEFTPNLDALAYGGDETEGYFVDQLLLPPENATFAPITYEDDYTAPVEGIKTSGFGFRTHPITKNIDFHKAIDIAAPSGTPIKAFSSGIVSRVGESKELGNFIEIDHQNGVKTLYAHCSKILKKEKNKVKTGDKIAKVGTTGMSTGDHLHFTFCKDDVYYDPEDLVYKVDES